MGVSNRTGFGGNSEIYKKEENYLYVLVGYKRLLKINTRTRRILKKFQIKQDESSSNEVPIYRYHLLPNEKILTISQNGTLRLLDKYGVMEDEYALPMGMQGNFVSLSDISQEGRWLFVAMRQMDMMVQVEFHLVRIDGDFYTGKNYFSPNNPEKSQQSNSTTNQLKGYWHFNTDNIINKPKAVAKVPSVFQPMCLTYLNRQRTIPMVVALDDYCNLVSFSPNFKDNSGDQFVYAPFCIGKLFQKGSAVNFSLTQNIQSLQNQKSGNVDAGDLDSIEIFTIGEKGRVKKVKFNVLDLKLE